MTCVVQADSIINGMWKQPDCQLFPRPLPFPGRWDKNNPSVVLEIGALKSLERLAYGARW